ncbi:Mu-like prophage I protein [Rhizobium sp. RU35A]|uniref:phage protease n=1 Tax=Rhizobium sp. RU35A TaxID=1907414 RepID=UPI0009575435|nr:phage protease [Rhizobium sp. RU35A]SIQ78076.1 Mu-like prophage I protein [Rhizobium sp. RU35A]
MAVTDGNPSALTVDLSNQIAADNSQWVHILPAGKSQGRDGRGPWSLTDPAAVMLATSHYHGTSQMVVDYEHQSLTASKGGHKAPAAGWISGLEARPNGIWAKVQWTVEAANLIRGKAYRYLSPVFQHDAAGNVTRVINVALTNTPNLDLTAVARSEVFSMNEEQMAELRNLLGLAADADFTTVRDAVATLMHSANTASPDPSKFVPIGEFERVVSEGNKLRQGIGQQAAEAHVDGLIKGGALAPFLKGWAVNLCSINKPQLDGFIARTGPHFTQMMSVQVRSATPSSGQTAVLSDSELAVCRTMGLTEAEFISAREGA